MSIHFVHRCLMIDRHCRMDRFYRPGTAERSLVPCALPAGERSSKWRCRASVPAEHALVGLAPSLQTPAQQQVSQHDGIVMRLVMGCEHERYRTLPCLSAQLAEMLGMSTHFAGVPASELLPTSWIVAEPLPQRGAGRDVLEP